jgi:mannose-6-phosphate isomerase
MIIPLKNGIQHYLWGGKFPADFTNLSDTREPQAELWMGTHPRLPSKHSGTDKSLADYVQEQPEALLGEAASYGELPFLFKVLSAAKPLSIQAHPSKDQAQRGFSRENALGIPLDAQNRNYKDNNHKPEILSPITEFTALSGFRESREIIEFFGQLNAQELVRILKEDGIAKFYQAIVELPQVERARLIQLASSLEGNEGYWISRLQQEFPDQLGVLAPLYLNLIHIKPGEALYMDAGILHAYLEGTGIELMANSDNVLRAGCTKKHVDVPELLQVLKFIQGPPELIKPILEDGWQCFHTEAEEFTLSRREIGEETLLFHTENVPHILLLVQGSISVQEEGDGKIFRLSPGNSLFIAADSPAIRIKGSGLVFRAGYR